MYGEIAFHTNFLTVLMWLFYSQEGIEERLDDVFESRGRIFVGQQYGYEAETQSTRQGTYTKMCTRDASSFRIP